MEGNTRATVTMNDPSTPEGRSIVDIGYIVAIPGILKVLEMVIGVICIGCVGYLSHAAQSFFLAVVCICLLVTLLFYIFHMFRLGENAKVPWGIAEVVFGIAAAIAYLVASCVQAAFTYGYGAYIAAAVFGFINTIVYAVGTFFSFQDWRATKKLPS